MSRKPRLVFLYVRKYANFGSSVMRAHQLSDIVRRHAGDRLQVDLEPMPSARVPGLQALWALSRRRGDVYFLTKACVVELGEENARRLQAGAAGVFFDHVDVPIERIRVAGADLHICSSYAQYDALQARKAAGQSFEGEPYVVLHNTDLRLEDVGMAQQTRVAPVYFGAPRNTYIPDALRDDIRVLPAMTDRQFDRTLPLLADFNLHYAVRAADPGFESALKPFLKGFTAAALDAVVLADRQVCDAERFLGADYPFLTEGRLDADIVPVFEHARDSFGGREWLLARERMRSMRERTSAASIAAQVLGAMWHVAAL